VQKVEFFWRPERERNQKDSTYQTLLTWGPILTLSKKKGPKEQKKEGAWATPPRPKEEHYTVFIGLGGERNKGRTQNLQEIL